MQIDHDRIIGYSRDRYFLVDDSGGRVNTTRHEMVQTAYVQKPSALRTAEQCGFGVYDARERKVILEPNIETRLDRVSRLITSLERDLWSYKQERQRLV